MTSKRSLPYDEPPSPESSEEEEEEDEQQTPLQTPSKPLPEPVSESESDEEGEEEEEEEEEGDVSEDEDEDEEVPVTPTPVASSKKLPEPEPVSVPEPEPVSESESESDKSPKVSSYTIKPIVKEKGTKVSKNKPEDKATTVNRLWNYDEEISILQGLIDFKKENNKDASSNSDEFYNYVKTKLTDGKFTKVQVRDKVSRLKRKFKEILNKSSGKDPEFSTSHDLKCFQLSKRSWGPVDSNDNADVNVNAGVGNANVVDSKPHKNVTVVGIPAKGQENGNSFVKTGGSKSAKKSKIVVEKVEKAGKVARAEEEKAEKVEKAVARVEEDMMDLDNKVEKNKDMGRLYPHLMKAFEGESLPKVPILDELKSCLGKADSLQLEEWDRKWKKIRLAETDAYISRLALVQEQTSWVLNGMKSSK